MEGVMMRNGNVYGLAVRKPDGSIYVARFPWKSLVSNKCLKIPFIRGFPILLETLVNGINALNHSVCIAEDLPETSRHKVFLRSLISLVLAIVIAVALFVITPHLLSLVMLAASLGTDVDGISFHLWDGAFKCAVFIGYIALISQVPEIRRFFQYHGAEHKTILAFEHGLGEDYLKSCGMSRLHPRCGTTFLLFVICITIVLQALFIPFLLKIWLPENMILKQALAIGYKLLLIAPVSACAYELIRFAARQKQGVLSGLLLAPGLALQRLTTREPDLLQLEVAACALKMATEEPDEVKD